MDQVRHVPPPSKPLVVEGLLGGEDELRLAVPSQHGKPDEDRKRWHLAHPIAQDGRTWILNNNWEVKTRYFFKQPLAIAPDGYSVSEGGDTLHSVVTLLAIL